MLTQMGSAELAEWMAYERIAGPLGGRRGDIQAAIVAATVANAQRPKGKRALKPQDFLPVWDRVPKTPEQLWTAAMAAFRPTRRDRDRADN